MSRAEPLAMVAGSPSHCIGHMTCSGKDTQGSIGKGTQRSPSGIRSPAGASAMRPGRLHHGQRSVMNADVDLNPDSLSHRDHTSTLLLRTAVTRQHCCDRVCDREHVAICIPAKCAGWCKSLDVSVWLKGGTERRQHEREDYHQPWRRVQVKVDRRWLLTTQMILMFGPTLMPTHPMRTWRLKRPR